MGFFCPKDCRWSFRIDSNFEEAYIGVKSMFCVREKSFAAFCGIRLSRPIGEVWLSKAKAEFWQSFWNSGNFGHRFFPLTNVHVRDDGTSMIGFQSIRTDRLGSGGDSGHKALNSSSSSKHLQVDFIFNNHEKARWNDLSIYVDKKLLVMYENVIPGGRPIVVGSFGKAAIAPLPTEMSTMPKVPRLEKLCCDKVAQLCNYYEAKTIDKLNDNDLPNQIKAKLIADFAR